MRAIRSVRNALTAACLLGQLLFLLLMWSRLPSTLPMHFAVTGQPNGYGPRAELWLLVALSFLLAAVLEIPRHFPEKINLPAGRGSQDRLRQETIALDMIGWLRLELVLLLSYVLFDLVQVAVHPDHGFGEAVIIVAPGLIVVTAVLFLARMLRSRS